MHNLLRNHKNPDSIEWRHLDKETYIEIENILTDGVKFFDAFVVDDFYPQDMFDELVSICTSNDLSKLDYSHQMNKWEEGVEIPKKFFDYAEIKVRHLLGTDDVIYAYHMYAHHQITSEGRVPKLGLHIDEAPGPYMVDLHIGGNRDWGFVSRFTNFVCKPNQAIICQPQFEYHYRPPWGSTDPNEYYQAFFIHMINKNHWTVPSHAKWGTRSKELEEKYEFGQAFRQSEVFAKFNDQRNFIFRDDYIRENKILNAPPIPLSETPLGEDMHIHQRKGVTPAV
jgi:hypothetical protein